MNNKQYAVFEKVPAHGSKSNGVILGSYNTKEEAQSAGEKYGYNTDNYYVGEYNWKLDMKTIPIKDTCDVRYSRDENNRRMIETYHSLLNNELKQFDESKQYLEFKCSNDQCDVCNYSSHFSLAICSLRYRPNSGCFKCGSKINVSIKTNQNNEYEKIIFQ
jgi:hypothetical protein